MENKGEPVQRLLDDDVDERDLLVVFWTRKVAVVLTGNENSLMSFEGLFDSSEANPRLI